MLQPEALDKMKTRLIALWGKKPLRVWQKALQKEEIEKKMFLNQYVRLVLRPSNRFQKKSQKFQLGLELFKVHSVRPTKDDYEKSILLNITDRNDEKIKGSFMLHEVKLVPKESTFHPDNPKYRPIVSKIIKVVKTNKRDKFQVNLAGKKN